MTETRTNILEPVAHEGYETCAACGGLVEYSSEWCGEDHSGRGVYRVYESCPDCGRWKSYKEFE